MEYHIKTPVDENTVRKLRAGDVIYITGTMVTMRDEGHARFLTECEEPPVDLKGAVLYHCGPIIKRNGNGYEVVSAGPTTSMRLEKYEADFIGKTGVSVIIGKGGMGEKTAEACVKNGCVHGIFPGGCAVSAAVHVKKVKGVVWEDLGMPEAMWIFEADDFGPVTVNIDAAGGNLMMEKSREMRERL
ncbi:MAG: FumA C-terminus/TtdB family hydratase beta subunit [Clostridia bacterium]|nr:FumA C-terminus/TtdB family hydratase beta subunit [Clostridia bacterium]